MIFSSFNLLKQKIKTQEIEVMNDSNIKNHAMSFLRKSSFAFLTSPFVYFFLVARTFLFSAPLDFLIFLFNYFSAFLWGFLFGKIANFLNLKLGSYLAKYCWLS